MAKTRLNVTHRLALKNFAKENISCPAEEAAVERTYELAAAMVASAVQSKFPLADMAVLERYDVATQDECIRGGTPSGTFIGFEFRDDRPAPLVPDRSCGSRSIPFSQDCTDAIVAYDRAKSILEKARAAKYEKYQALVNSARYFEDVVEIWPAAKELADKICKQSTSLVALSDDVRAFIATDNAGQRAAA
jgi:hypothetical protein